MSNVVRIADIIERESALSTIENFANERGINSESTRTAYLSDCKQFIKMVLGEQDYITTESLARSINRTNVTNFRNRLINENSLKGTAVRRKLSVLKELSKHLYFLGYNVDFNLFETLQTVKTTSNSYEVLSYEEAIQIIDWIGDNEKYDADKKYYYCSLAFDTGIRANALNSLTPASFIETDEEVIIKGVDKGLKAFRKSISVEFYQQMVYDLDIDELDMNEPIFNFSKQNRSDMMHRAKKALGWENRNITFHSFKKGAVSHAYNVSKDILLAQKVGNHSSVVTTQRYLTESEEVFQGALSDRATVEAKNISLDDYSKEELLEAFMKLSEGTQNSIKKELHNKSNK